MGSDTAALLVPLGVLVVFGAAVPAGICRLSVPGSRRGLLLRLAVAALVLLLFASGLFAVLYAGAGARVSEAARESLAASVVFFLRLGLLSALAWGPMLIFAGIGEALRLERRRSERMMREG